MKTSKVYDEMFNHKGKWKEQKFHSFIPFAQSPTFIISIDEVSFMPILERRKVRCLEIR